MLEEKEEPGFLTGLKIPAPWAAGKTVETVHPVSRESKTFYKQYQQDGDYIDLWKRNLGYVVNCRTIEEVLKHPHIDDPFKVFFQRSQPLSPTHSIT